MKIVGINGSPRRGGNTEKLILTVLNAVEVEGIETEFIQLGGSEIRGCQSCYRCVTLKDQRCSSKNDGFNTLFEKLLEADGIVLGSPTYFADITPEMKALIDRAGFVARVNGNLLRHKAGAAVVSMRRAGGIHAFDSINHLFQISGMFTVGSTYWNLGFGGREGSEVEKDLEGMENMEDLGHSMAFLLKKLSQH